MDSMQNKKNSLITEVNDNADGQGSSTRPLTETHFGQPGELTKMPPSGTGSDAESGETKKSE